MPDHELLCVFICCKRIMLTSCFESVGYVEGVYACNKHCNHVQVLACHINATFLWMWGRVGV